MIMSLYLNYSPFFFLTLQVIVGLKDKNEAVVSETFRGLADLVPILGVKDVVGSTSTSIFVDRKPDVSILC